jgi:prepilin signal peptidase PulO-like enzyme (type II secretory pathway)
MLLVLLVVGLAAGALINWAVYTLAWHPRPISPWAPPHPQAPPRTAADRLPLVGWWRLRREAPLHGRGFWIRPLAVELAAGAGLPALYWWEVVRQGLVQPQLAALGAPRAVAPWEALWPVLLTHSVLVTLMAAASLIDIDEKIIPDEITVPGTLLGLVLAACLPQGLLPQATLRNETPPVGAVVALPAGLIVQGSGGCYVEPVTATAPHLLPKRLAGRTWESLALGGGCYLLWCLALTPRIWRGRRGWRRAASVLAARVLRELTRPPLAAIAGAGLVGIVGVWAWGGAAWIGLITALIGLVGSGALVWAVRIIGAAALRREAMGFGDVTLMMMVGTYLGWQAGVMAFFVAPFAGLAVGVAQAVLRRDDVIPYGPFLCLGCLAIMLRWGSLWDPAGLRLFFEEAWLAPVALSVCMFLLGGMLLVWRQIKEALWRNAT